MANKEHIALLNQGVNVWNQWRTEHPDIVPDLSGANLRNANFEGADLSGANLAVANLKGSYLNGTNLKNIVLSQAILNWADLTGADLRGAVLDKTIFSNSTLRGANLSGLNLTLVTLIGADLTDAILRNADLSNTDCSGANLSRADLWHANLREANLRGVNLTTAKLMETDISGADVSMADLRHADLWQANLTGANLSEAHLGGANISGANFSDANLSKAHLSEENLLEANFSGANLSGVHLSAANVRGTDISDSLLEEILSATKNVRGTDISDSLLKELLAGTLGPPKSTDTTDGDTVQFTAYYPRDTEANTRYSFLLYAHTEEAFEKVADDVEKFRDELGNKVPPPKTAKQTSPIKLDTPITIVPESEQIEFDPPSLTKKWSGEWTRFGFDFKPTQAMSGDTLFVRVSVQVATVEVAHINCAVDVMEQKAESTQDIAEEENPLAEAKLSSNTSELYQKIFISYSRKDKGVVNVYKLVQEAVGNVAFMDTYSIRAGEDWRSALAHAINQADIFQLFWSDNSAGSPNVRDEWEYALMHKCPETRCVGFIRPVCWNDPIKPSPPEELGHLNFKYVPLDELVTS